jgi:predicted SnoaL-like aldol condensation-catalyzing enzyme
MKTNYLLNYLVVIVVFLFSCNNENSSNMSNQVVIDSLKNQINMLSENEKRLNDNKKIVADFYQDLFGNKNISAIDKYIGDIYIQHNPMLPDGKEALKNGAKEWFKGAPKEKIDIQHLSADGDLVYIHTKSMFGKKVFSVMDIFKLKDNKIVEHWDIIQQVPEKSNNPHPMF